MVKRNKSYYYKKETDIFMDIWSERIHFCEECGRYLGSDPKRFYFSHILSKGSHPNLRLSKDNIILLCFDCHRRWDFRDRNKMLVFEKYKKRIETLKRISNSLYRVEEIH